MQHYRLVPDRITIAVILLGLLALIIAALVIAQRRPAYPPPATDATDIMGIVVRDPWYDFGNDPAFPGQPNRVAQDQMGEMLAHMGVQWVRLEFHTEGGDRAAEEQLARYDYFIREVAPRHGFKILGLLSYGLVRGNDPQILGQTTFEHDPIYGPGIDNAKRIWLDRARLVVDRYEGAIAAYQVLNEPNRVSPFWYDDLPAVEVARLHTTFYTHFRHIDRAASEQAWRDTTPIIFGGIQPAGTGQFADFGHIPDTYYLRQIYGSEPFVAYHERYGRYPLDGLGYHPYPVEIAVSNPPPPAPEGNASPASAATPPDPQQDMALLQQRLDEVRAVLVELGDPQQPFWITEIGYNAGYSQQTAEGQEEFMRLVFAALPQREDVARIFWFKYEDFPPASGPQAQQWGTVIIPFEEQWFCLGGGCYDPEGRPSLLRPSFWTYRELMGAGENRPEPPAEVITRGPLSAFVGDELTFTAQVRRPTATQPITYTWQVTERGQIVHADDDLQDTLTFTWLRPGIYTLLIEARNAGGPVIDLRMLKIYRPGTLDPPRLEKR